MERREPGRRKRRSVIALSLFAGITAVGSMIGVSPQDAKSNLSQWLELFGLPAFEHILTPQVDIWILALSIAALICLFLRGRIVRLLRRTDWRGVADSLCPPDRTYDVRPVVKGRVVGVAPNGIEAVVKDRDQDKPYLLRFNWPWRRKLRRLAEGDKITASGRYAFEHPDGLIRLADCRLHAYSRKDRWSDHDD